jgi:hypothetical protein
MEFMLTTQITSVKSQSGEQHTMVQGKTETEMTIMTQMIVSLHDTHMQECVGAQDQMLDHLILIALTSKSRFERER